jgi:hypothetical protein
MSLHPLALAEAAPHAAPMREVGVRETFGIDSDLVVPAFAEREEHVPEIDAVYRFQRHTSLAILAGFAQDRRVLVQGLHGTGKSTHIEQVAARLNWPCVSTSTATSAGSISSARTRSSCAKASRSPSSRRASCRERCSGRWRSSSTSTTPAGPTRFS